MTILRDMSLRYKLTVISMVACLIALMLAGIAFVAYDHQETKTNMVSDLETLADVIGANCTVAIAFDNAQDATETLASLAAEEYISTAWVYRSDGTVLANYSSKGYQGHDVPKPMPGQGPVFGTDYLDVFRNILIEGETVGAVYLRMDLKPLEDRLANIVTAIALVILATSLVVLTVVSRLQRVVSEPILNLTAIAKRFLTIVTTRLGYRYPVETKSAC